MLWRVHTDLAFDIEDEAHDFFHDCELAQAKSVTINPGQPNEERGYSYLEECHHDDDPSTPCVKLQECQSP